MADPDQRNRLGQQLGSYKLVRLLARGGFAEVYLAQHRRLDMQAAVKVLYTYLNEQEITNFQQEAQTVAKLVHPNIVRLLDFDVDDGVPFLVMDYAPQGTLRGRHRRGMRVALPTVISYVKQVADALQYAHDHCLIHRDIKPENMLIGRRNEVVLSDFGIAAIAHSTSSMATQASVGTVPYMAPEQIQAHARPASDLYALGVVVYEWLCGERPFDGSFSEVCAKHLMTPPPSLRQKVPTLSADVEQVVLTALHKDPRQRFNNVQAFAKALEQASQAGPSQPEGMEFLVSPFSATIAPPHGSLPPLGIPVLSPEIEPTSILPRSPETEPTSILPQSPEPGMNGRKLLGAQIKKRHISRRAVLVSLAGVGLVAVGGSIGWWVFSPHSPIPPYTYRGHSDRVNAVAWSPDGKRIASGSDDKTVQAWDATDGGHVSIYRGHSDWVNTVAWSSDGKRIASGSNDKTVQVWDAANGGNVFTYPKHSDWVNGVAWSPDSKRIASGSNDKTVQVWDAADGGNVFTYRGHSGWVSAVAWSPDGKRIASCSWDNTIQVWDAADGRNAFTYHGHASMVCAIAWSPDGTRIVSGSWDDTVQVWDATDGSNAFTYRGHLDLVNGVAWSPDGKRIASGSTDKTVQVWDAADGGNVFTYRKHSNYVQAVAWSPDSQYVASGSEDNTVQVWNA